jgi:carboxypeptidase C (cathepsin A)
MNYTWNQTCSFFRPDRFSLISFLAILLLWVCHAPAQDESSSEDEKESAFVVYPDDSSVTFHSVTINGQLVHYQATAGTLTLANLRGDHEPTAQVFYIAYKKLASAHQEGVDPVFPDAATRPITFSFNGGPGSSSVWLHLGVFGPKRVNPVDEFGNPGPPPYAMVENEYSLLDQSDFVFIDPVATGYSRAADEKSPKDFHGVSADINSVAEFIRIYLGKENRWGSPKYIAGESYGTTRAAGLVDELQDTHGIALNGVILVSAIMNFQTARFDVGNDLPYPLFLPSFAATAKFHNALSSKYQNMDLEKFLREVEDFALNEYTLALTKGDQLSESEQNKIAKKLADYTGVSVQYAKQTQLRINMPRFPKELLRDEGKTVGRLDSRFTSWDRDDAGDSYEFDPSYTAIQSIYTEGMNAYLREDLGYSSDMRYEILTNVWPWSFRGVGDNQYLNVAERLRQAMHKLPYMKVFIANGYYDLATPYFATQYTIDHMFLRPEVKSNIEMHYYEAGHMMYAHRGMLAKMKADLDGYYQSRKE